MITFSGIRLEPEAIFDGEYTGAPTLADLALGLGRTPRFGGHTRRWWTVLHHSLVCEGIARGAPDKLFLHRKRLFCLLHDAHEAITGDIPSFWKTEDMRRLQEELDKRIFAGLGLPMPNDADASFVKEIDTRALRAEAAIVGPPAIGKYMKPGLPEDEQVVKAVLATFPEPHHTNGVDSPAAQAFYNVFASLIGEAATRTVDHT